MVASCRMRVVDLSAEVSAKGALLVIEALLERESAVPFEQYREPPVRAVLARLGHEEHFVAVHLHHVRTCRQVACSVLLLHLHVYGLSV